MVSIVSIDPGAAHAVGDRPRPTVWVCTQTARDLPGAVFPSAIRLSGFLSCGYDKRALGRFSIRLTKSFASDLNCLISLS